MATARSPIPFPQSMPPPTSEAGSGPFVDPFPPPPYACEFVMEGAPLPSNEGVRPWATRHGEKVADCVRKALLLPSDMEQWKGMEGQGMIYALKRNMVLVSSCFIVFFVHYISRVCVCVYYLLDIFDSFPCL